MLRDRLMSPSSPVLLIFGHLRSLLSTGRDNSCLVCGDITPYNLR
jgi:hypothetical protein